MAFIRCCVLTASTLFLYFNITAQTVYYPLQASSLLKSTAADAVQLFKKAMPRVFWIYFYGQYGPR